jgi:hypothetical protein
MLWSVCWQLPWSLQPWVRLVQKAFWQLGPPNPPAQEHFPFVQPQS